MNWDKTIDTIQLTLLWFVVCVITICTAVLFLFDVLAGTGTMLFLTNAKEWQSVVISLATTGLLFTLMFMGYMMVENKSKVVKSFGWGIVAIAGVIYILDIIFDALLADVLRFETIQVSLKVDALQWMFRGLMGGISTIGDALAFAMILGMPILKNILNNAIPENLRKSSSGNNQNKSKESPYRSTPNVPYNKPIGFDGTQFVNRNSQVNTPYQEKESLIDKLPKKSSSENLPYLPNSQHSKNRDDFNRDEV